MQFNPRPIRLPNFIQKPPTPLQKIQRQQRFSRLAAGAYLATMRSQDHWLQYRHIELKINNRANEANTVLTTVNFSASNISKSIIQQGSQVINNVTIQVCCETPQLLRLAALLGKVEEQDNLTQKYKLYSQRLNSPSTSQSLTGSEREESITLIQSGMTEVNLKVDELLPEMVNIISQATNYAELQKALGSNNDEQQ